MRPISACYTSGRGARHFLGIGRCTTRRAPNQKFEEAPRVDFACRNPCGVDFSISYADRGDCTFAVRLIEVTPRPSHE